VATKSSFQRVMAERINCAPAKLILNVTVQLPTKVNLAGISDKFVSVAVARFCSTLV
jgi:hypothetical protein